MVQSAINAGRNLWIIQGRNYQLTSTPIRFYAHSGNQTGEFIILRINCQPPHEIKIHWPKKPNELTNKQYQYTKLPLPLSGRALRCESSTNRRSITSNGKHWKLFSSKSEWVCALGGNSSECRGEMQTNIFITDSALSPRGGSSGVSDLFANAMLTQVRRLFSSSSVLSLGAKGSQSMCVCWLHIWTPLKSLSLSGVCAQPFVIPDGACPGGWTLFYSVHRVPSVCTCYAEHHICIHFHFPLAHHARSCSHTIVGIGWSFCVFTPPPNQPAARSLALAHSLFARPIFNLFLITPDQIVF